ASALVTCLDIVDVATGTIWKGEERLDEFGDQIEAWGPANQIRVADRKRVRVYQLKQDKLELEIESSEHERRTVLCWNGDSVGLPTLDITLDDFAGISLPTRRAARNFVEKQGVLAKIRQGTGPLEFVASSPTGRFLALAVRETPTLEIVDLMMSKSRTFRLDSSIRKAWVFWAPSGRKLAVATVQGLTIVELGADPLAALDSQWKTVLDDDSHDDPEFFDKLVHDKRPVVTEWLLRQVETPLDTEYFAFVVANAASALAKRRVPVDVARVKAAQAKMPPIGGGLRDYRHTVERLLRVQESLARGETCDCSVGFRRPQDHGQLEAVGENVHRCRACRRRWRIIEDASFHFPTYEISEL